MIPELSLVPETLPVPATAFWMGETPNDKFATDTERPRHRVTFLRRFALGVHPVTVEEYRCFAPEHQPAAAPRWPVTNVSWDDATGYCEWLGQQTGEAFRLPSEAEWECACRAGTDTCFCTGDDLSLEQANFLYAEDGQRVGRGALQPVGTYPANQYGLHDLHGNVAEFCVDVWNPNHRDAPSDGSARTAGPDPSRRVIRGGAWDYLPRLLRSAWRDGVSRTQRRDNLGFRVALTLD